MMCLCISWMGSVDNHPASRFVVFVKSPSGLLPPFFISCCETTDFIFVIYDGD